MSSSSPAAEMTSVVPTSANSAWGTATESDDFDYTPVSPWGPVALFLGIASITGLSNSIFGLCLALVSAIIGVSAVVRIRATAGAYKGSAFALFGTVLSVFFLCFGSAKLVNAYKTECPEGFRRVHFPDEISKFQFAYYGTQRRLHPAVAPLIGEKIFLKGYMWQTQQSENLREFILLKDNGECCYGGDPKPYDFMIVRMKGNAITRGYTGMVSVAGVLSANVHAKDKEAVYSMEATMVEQAQTAF